MPDLHGVVYTREWVVDLILDIAGYTADKPLWKQRVAEPSCGYGSFLHQIVKRLMESAFRAGKNDVLTLRNCIVSYDLDPIAVERSRAIIVDELLKHGITKDNAQKLAVCWVRNEDYLLSRPLKCDYVVGNPPYLRATEIPPDAQSQYCLRYSAMTKGCDIYVAFIQRGLECLKDKASVLCLICADRWMQNQYGRKLREFIVEKYHIDSIVRMHGVDAFETEVSAYPAITRIDHGRGKIKYVDCKHDFNQKNSEDLREWIDGVHSDYSSAVFSATLLNQPTGSSVIPIADPQKVKTIISLINRFPSLENSGVKLGIGLATGRDDVFIVHDPETVESERMLPAFNMKDWRRGKQDSQCWIVNPWNKDGTLVDLAEYPKLNEYLNQHKSDIANRHIAKKDTNAWYRTIDKVNWAILGTPMLLFPDMASKAEPVYCDGTKYPCHNCYWVISDKWDIKVLGGLLMSDIAESFIDAMGVKMRGGTMRFQAQYLRLIHVPQPETIPKQIADQLRSAFEKNNRKAANQAALLAYGLES